MKPHDVPSTGELVEAVREWLQSDVMAATDGRLSVSHPRCDQRAGRSSNASSCWAPAREASHRASLAIASGVADDAALAAAIRSGELDDRLPEVRALVWQSVRDKLAVANPRYLASS